MSKKHKINMVGLAGNPKVITGVFISLAGIYWAFKDFHFFDFKRSIQQIDLVYLILATIYGLTIIFIIILVVISI